MIREILQGKSLNSNIAPIARIGRPVRSAYSRAADAIQTPDSRIGILGTAGNWTSGLANALKGGLGFYGAMKDAQAEQAYNDYLAQQAEQDRADKLAQQQAEMDYKNRSLEQQAMLAQNAIDAQREMENTKFGHQKELINKQTQAATEAKNLAMRQQGIDPKRYGYDEEYTKAVNAEQVAKEAEKQRVESYRKLLESGKYSPDDVEKVIQDPERFSLIYDKPSAFTAFFGRNPNRIVDNGNVTKANFGNSMSAVDPMGLMPTILKNPGAK